MNGRHVSAGRLSIRPHGRTVDVGREAEIGWEAEVGSEAQPRESLESARAQGMSRKVAIMPRSRRSSCNSRLRGSPVEAFLPGAVRLRRRHGRLHLVRRCDHSDGALFPSGPPRRSQRRDLSRRVSSHATRWRGQRQRHLHRPEGHLHQEGQRPTEPSSTSASTRATSRCGPAITRGLRRGRPCPTSTYLGTPSGQTIEPGRAGDTVVTSLSESATATYAEVHDLTNHQYWFNDYTSPVEKLQPSTSEVSST